MGLFKLFSLLAVVASTVASPLDPADETVSVTVTVTTTAATAVTPIPNPATEVSVITRTRTVTAWTRTTTLVSVLNCTRTVLTGGAPVRTTPSRLPPRPTATLLPRQNATSIAPTTARPSIPIPTLAPGRRRTRTSWSVTTVTPSGDLRRTRYECGATLEYIYTVDATTTQWLTITSYPNVVTSTSLIACFPPAGGRPPIPTGTPGRPPLPTTSLASVTLTAPPLPPTPPIFKRQNATSTAVVGGLRNSTVTLHITSTLYSFTTVINTNTTTALGWACSPFSTSLVLSTTISVPPVPVPTPVTSIIPVTTSVTVLPRPSAPSAPAGSSAVGTNLPSVILTLTRAPLPTVSETPPTLLPSPSPVQPTQ